MDIDPASWVVIGIVIGAAHRQPIGRIVQEAMSTRLRLEEQGECGIAGDFDLFDRIHLHGDFQGHETHPFGDD